MKKEIKNINEIYHPKALEIVHKIIVDAGFSAEEADRKIAALISDALIEINGEEEQSDLS